MGKINLKLNEVEKFDSIKDMLNKAVAACGDKPLYKWRAGKEIKSASYNEFRKTVDALGTALSSIGMATKHVATTGENSYDWICTYLTMLMHLDESSLQ